MQHNEKINDKASLPASQQPKKTWQEPELIVLDINGGLVSGDYEKYGTLPPPSSFPA